MWRLLGAEGRVVGRPSKFRPEFVKVAQSMGLLGATDVEIADALGVNIATFYRWKAADSAFCDAIKSGKEPSDARVERSLYARANGYEHDEVDLRVVDGALVETQIRKFYPPDTTAAIFWLKNRKPDEWRDRSDIAVDITDRAAELLKARQRAAGDGS